MPNALNMISGRWLRMAPEQSSMPLQTMSYCQALMVSGSCVSSASNPPCGIENGLWLKSIFFAVSSYSNIGKSTIQQKANSPSAISPISWATLVRAWPANFHAPGQALELGETLVRHELGDRPFARSAVQHDVAEAGLALALGPAVQLVE